MLFKQEPPNFIHYVQIDAKLNTILQENGFQPMYEYEGFFYYKDSQELKDFIEKGVYEIGE